MLLSVMTATAKTIRVINMGMSIKDIIMQLFLYFKLFNHKILIKFFNNFNSIKT